MKLIWHYICFIDNGQTYFNFKYIYLKLFKLFTPICEVAHVERTNQKFIIEVITMKKQHENIKKN